MCSNQRKKNTVVDGKKQKALALLCLTSGRWPNAANSSDVSASMLRELRELLICNNHGSFSWESGDRPPCWPRDSTVRRKKHGCEQKRKTEGTGSAMFGVGTGAKCYRTGELKRCADRVRSRTQETESPQRQISVCNLNCSPSTFTV